MIIYSALMYARCFPVSGAFRGKQQGPPDGCYLPGSALWVPGALLFTYRAAREVLLADVLDFCV